MINNLFPTHFSKTFEVVIKMPTNCLPWEAILINVSTQLARRSYCGVDWALERNNLSESFVDSMEWRWNAAAYFFSQRVNIEDYAESLVHRVVLSFFILCSSKRNESFKNTWQCLKTSELISLVKILPVLSCTASLPRTRKKRTTKLAQLRGPLKRCLGFQLIVYTGLSALETTVRLLRKFLQIYLWRTQSVAELKALRLCYIILVLYCFPSGKTKPFQIFPLAKYIHQAKQLAKFKQRGMPKPVTPPVCEFIMNHENTRSPLSSIFFLRGLVN